MPNEETVFDFGELAKYLKVPLSWVRRNYEPMQIPHIRIGKYVRFPKGLIDQWIEQQSFHAEK